MAQLALLSEQQSAVKLSYIVALVTVKPQGAPLIQFVHWCTMQQHLSTMHCQVIIEPRQLRQQQCPRHNN